MKWVILAIVDAFCLYLMVGFIVDSNVVGYAVASGVLVVFTCAVIIINVLTKNYLKSSKEDAYKLLKKSNPDVKQIQEAIKDLSRFPKDQEAKKLIEELTKKRIET